MDYRALIAAYIAPLCKMEIEEVCPMLEVPPSPDMGDWALPCFKLSKLLKKAPPVIAQELMDALNLIGMPAVIKRVGMYGGYLNFFLDETAFAKAVIGQVLTQKDRYGARATGSGRVVCIDYSSINIAKRMHIGHLSTTAIGHSLYRIYEFCGYKCVGINHLGDWGTQFGKLIVALKAWSGEERIRREGVAEMVRIYVKFHDEAEKNPRLEDDARAWFKRIEDGDGEALRLHQLFKDITLEEVMSVYELMGVEFDSYDGEAFYNDKMQPVIDELREKNLLEQDKGAYVVRFADEDKMPPCLILKQDGATLYATRDIAAAVYRKNTYGFYKSLYVVAYQQNLHFAQFFKVLELMGYEWARDLTHVAFGMVSMEEGTMSSRKGTVVLLEDVLSRAVEKTLALMEEKSPGLENKPEIARAVGVGAVMFSALSSARIKDIVFSWDRVLNFDGETGPYCMYTHARCCSVLRKAGQSFVTGESAALSGNELDDAAASLTEPEEQAVLKLIASFPESVASACERNEPYVVTRHVVELCQAYNKFYYEKRILDAQEPLRAARLALTMAARTVIKNGLYLIGLSAPEQM